MKQEEELTYIKAGFLTDQINEIREGANAGLDISVYAKKEFLAIQMRQIRFGMLDHLSVEVYAKTAYDWFQMEEIREGLKAGVDTALYASPDIPYDKMRQIRLGLLEGVDLSGYLDREAGIIREIRRALRSGINLTEYIKEGFTTEQIEQIRIALEKGVNIRQYLSRELRGVSIREIGLGLSKGLDVSCYAKAECSWQQMREIRLGLEHRIDVSHYQSPLYEWQQMHEIRLGLEEGIHVDAYCSLMYPYTEMKKKRLALEAKVKEAEQLQKETSQAELEMESYKNFRVYISTDEMQAFLEFEEEAVPDKKDVLEALEEGGIVRGIDETAIERICTGQCNHQVVLVAKGEEAQNGKEGHYEYFFHAHKEWKPKQLPDGSVDYQNTEWFETVEEGQKVAYYHPAKPGVDGFTVTGKILPAKKGREKSLLHGEGFVLKEDRKTYVASVGGKIELYGTCLEITKLLVVNEVTQATGNIHFNGNVYVRGSVGSGTVIQTTEDVIVDGYVEAARIECGRNIVLRRGANGSSGAGLLKAGGSIRGKFFEAIDVYAGKEICANYCLNCNLYTEDKILVSGRKGSIAGGITHAAKGLESHAVGNRTGRFTYIKLGVSEALLREYKALTDEINEAKKELRILKNAYLDIQKKYPPEIRNTMELYLKIEDAIFTKGEQAKELLVAKAEKEEQRFRLQEARAVIRGSIYEGAVIEISGKKWAAKEVGNITVRNTGDRIAVYKNEGGRKE